VGAAVYPNINMNGIDLKTGQTRVNYDKLFKKDGDHIIGCCHNARGLWAIAYNRNCPGWGGSVWVRRIDSIGG
jgi:hypothetical protein